MAAVDHFIAELDAKGLVDHRRVYTLGASYGGHMAATYAMMRADRVAAFAAFATDAPSAAWSCGGPPPPGMVIYRACDGFFSCESVERWLRARDAVQAETAWLRLGAGNEEEPSCATRNKCTPRALRGQPPPLAQGARRRHPRLLRPARSGGGTRGWVRLVRPSPGLRPPRLAGEPRGAGLSRTRCMNDAGSSRPPEPAATNAARARGRHGACWRRITS